MAFGWGWKAAGVSTFAAIGLWWSADVLGDRIDDLEIELSIARKQNAAIVEVAEGDQRIHDRREVQRDAIAPDLDLDALSRSLDGLRPDAGP